MNYNVVPQVAREPPKNTPDPRQLAMRAAIPDLLPVNHKVVTGERNLILVFGERGHGLSRQ
jgi:hypothetical protein